jgi:hypothetical protein
VHDKTQGIFSLTALAQDHDRITGIERVSNSLKRLNVFCTRGIIIKYPHAFHPQNAREKK